MPESSSLPSTRTTGLGTSCLYTFTTISVLAPVIAAVLVYQLDSFQPAAIPSHELTRDVVFVPRRNPNMLRGSEKIGFGQLLAPEDIEYDPNKPGLIYTGCVDGWIKRVTVNESAADSMVEDWVNTGGRPLGIVHGHHNDLIVADADKGLLRITEDGKIELLTDEAESLKFKLTDAADIADDGIIYFSDASYRYSLKDFIWDFFEGRPNGRLLSYDPSTKQTKVLMKNLYFANGVVVSPDQNFVLVCESPMRRCKRYYIKGEKKGSVDVFIEKIPGMPDNIRYDGEGHYWIALAMELTYSWYLSQRYPVIRKVTAIITKYFGRPLMETNGGALAVDLQGKPTAHYHEPGLSLISSVNRIGDHLYFGSIVNPYIIRLNVTQYPALPVHQPKA